MALPAIDGLCKALDEFPELGLCVTMPGGATLCPQVEGLPPSLYQLARSALGQANAALAPLTPLFDIIETLVAIKDCVTAIPDALGPPPDPSKLAACVPNLIEKIEKVIALLPPASVLLTIAQLLDVIIAILQGCIDELRAVLRLLDRISRARLLAGRVPGLLSIIDCGQQSAEAQMSNIERAMASINPIIELINVIGSLAGLKPIPTFEGGLGDDPDVAIDTLQGLVDVLRVFRDSIPL